VKKSKVPWLTLQPWQVKAMENKRLRRVLLPVTQREEPIWNPIIVGNYGGWCNNHGRPLPCPLGLHGSRINSDKGFLDVNNTWSRKFSRLTSNEIMSTGIQFSDLWKPNELETRLFEEKWWDDFHFWENYPREVFVKQWDIDFPEYESKTDPWVWMVEFDATDITL
jgi:hypothetical protein